jgi:UDP-N-acetylmuramoyl-L-alanyl-D-glutamate--2,6-diaminopimelate ligase
MGREEIERGIAGFRGVPGRLERIEPEGHGLPYAAYVDYAHTPDALQRLLETVREMMDGGRLILVFGCGGGRDRTKRPEMAEAAARGADIVILTSDNPRDEDPMDIIRDAEKGLGGMRKAHEGRASFRELPEGEKVCVVVPDRAEAIREAVGAARAGDVLILAGKGHEDYQIVRGEKMPFDDRLELLKAMGEAN